MPDNSFYADGVCPICKSNEYKKVWTDALVIAIIQDKDGCVRSDEDELLVGFECCECSIMFGDPDKFYKKRS